MEKNFLQEMALVEEQLPVLHKLLENNTNVLHIAADMKMVDGTFTDIPALVVYVKEKHPIDQLTEEEKIPTIINGVLTDVSEPLKGKTFGSSREEITLKHPLRGGIGIYIKPQIGGQKGLPGTLGCLAVDNRTKELVGITNYHVLYSESRPVEGIPVHRADLPKDSQETTLLGSGGDRGKVGPNSDPGINNRGMVDAAKIIIAVPKSVNGFYQKNIVKDLGRYDPEGIPAALIPGDANLEGAAPSYAVRSPYGDFYKNVNVGDRVRKVGNATGLTKGIVKSINGFANIKNAPDGKDYYYKNLMVIALDPTPETPPPATPPPATPPPATPPASTNDKDDEKKVFSKHGDSGSVVVNDQNEVVGLLFGGQDLDDSGTPVAYATHIRQVLDTLDVTIFSPPQAILKHTIDKNNHLTVTFDGSSSTGAIGNIVSYLWRTGEFVNGEEVLNRNVTFTHTYAKAGIYQASLSVVDEGHIKDVSDLTITISEQPAPGGTKFTTNISKAEHIEKHPLQLWTESLQQTERGAGVVDFIQLHIEEIRKLVHHNRKVMVNYQRKMGPYFLNEWYQALGNPEKPLVKEINGISLLNLLESLAIDLEDNGSAELKRAISKNILRILNAVDNHDTLRSLRYSILHGQA